MKTKKIASFLLKHEWWALAAVITIFVAISLTNIGRWPIWFDEGYSQFLAQFSYAKIAALTAVDVHPPLYYWALHTWGELFGYGESAIRSLSVTFGAVALLGLYAVMRRAFKRTVVPLLAIAFLAILPFFVHYAVETRMYTMAAAIVAWATYFLLRATDQKPQSWKWWIGYGVLVSAGMWTHYFTAFAWLAHWLWRIIERRRGTIKQFWTRYWVGAYALAVALFSPWLLIAYAQFTSVQGGFWIPPISSHTPVDYISNIFLFSKNDLVSGWGAVLFFVLTGLLLAVWYWHLKRQPKALQNSTFRLIFILALVPPLLLVLMSLPPFKSTFVDRYMTYSILFLVPMIITALWYAAPNKKARTVVLSLLAGVQIVGLVSLYVLGGLYNDSGNSAIQTRNLMYDIAKQDASKTPIAVLDKWKVYEATTYTTEQHPVVLIDDGEYPWGSYEPIRQQEGQITIVATEEASSEFNRLWVLDDSSTKDYETALPGWRIVQTIEREDPVRRAVYHKAFLLEK